MMLKSTYKPTATAAPSTVLVPLPSGWTEHRAPSGHAYYYNAETKQSTYTRPGTQPIALPPSILPSQTHREYNLNQGFPEASFQPGFDAQPHGFLGRHRGRGGLHSGHNFQDPRRYQNDRPKHKYNIPGCAPWILVKTKLGRRFVHNTETKESFWKVPPNVVEGVTKFDRLERGKKEKRERGESSDVDDMAEGEEEKNMKEDDQEINKTLNTSESRRVLATRARDEEMDNESEYEEVEVTDNEEEGGSSKRQCIEGEQPPPREFNENDMAWQLATMEEGDWQQAEDEPPLSDEDAKLLFKELLCDFNINPFSTWDRVIEEGKIIDDDRYTLMPNMKSRRDIWDEWSSEMIQALLEKREKEAKKDPRIPYMVFLQKHASSKLYWPEFRRKYRREQEMKDSKLSDKEREKWYREHINRLKLPHTTLKSDLTNLIKSLPISVLNRSTSMAALPPQLLTDIRYISLPPSTRDPMVETYISTLAPAPEATEMTVEETGNAMKKKQDRERRERALAEREKRVQEQMRKQQRDLAYGRVRLQEEELELQRAMRVGKAGLRAQLGMLEEPATSTQHESAGETKE